jgi:tetratricopeptide (TPR) repeat protein
LSAQKPDETVQNAIAERIPAILVSIPVFVIVAFYGFYAVTTVRAEATFKKSLDALARNDGNTTYNLMRTAIAINPFVDRYHASLAQVSFALANSMAQKPEGIELTDEERQTITVLIQQAIAEGKSTVSLNPTRSGSWELLGGIYRNVMAFADGADDFAVQSYSQAVALDPISPLLRVDLGGIYYALGNYDLAIDIFKLAVIAKPDLANARYNLAVAYREKGEIDKAIDEMTAVLTLVEKDSQDFEIAKQELANLESKKPVEEKAPSEGEELNPPEANEPAIDPQIQLPEEAAPPEPEVTPTPVPTGQEENLNATPTPEI